MATLGDLAKLVRSKNAGPFWLTIDIMFDDAEAYRRGSNTRRCWGWRCRVDILATGRATHQRVVPGLGGINAASRRFSSAPFRTCSSVNAFQMNCADVFDRTQFSGIGRPWSAGR